MKITKSKLSELIRNEIENFKPVNEKIKISKGHGRGQSWTNYHDDNDNRLQVTKVGNEYTAYFSKAGVSGSKNSVLLKGLSKIDAAKLVKMAKTAGLEKTAKHGKSKYKKNVSEAKDIHHSQAKALQVPKRHIKKLEKLLTKKYPPKSGRTRVEFDTKPVRVPGFIKVTTDKHIYDDVVELLIKLGIKVR